MAERNLLRRQQAQLQLSIDGKRSEHTKIVLAIELLQSLADEGQRKMLDLITKIASVGMSEVFSQDIKLVARIVEKRGAQGLELKLLLNGEERSFDQVGGGLIDVLSFVLQVAVVKLVGAAPILFLDEPFKHVSKNYLARISQLVNSLSEMMGLQILIVTHETQLVTGDRIYRFALENGVTVVTDESDD